MKLVMPLIIVFLLAIILLFLFGPVASPQALEDRTYHLYTIADITAENPADWKHPLTHLEVTGFVTYKEHEGDGDWHLRICDSKAQEGQDATHCLVAECIPKLPCMVPLVGSHVRIQGIGRYDAENPSHHWWEIHPAESVETIP